MTAAAGEQLVMTLGLLAERPGSQLDLIAEAGVETIGPSTYTRQDPHAMTALPAHLREMFTHEGWVVVDRRTGRVVEPPEPDDDDLCPGCGSILDDGCPRDCPELAAADAADQWIDEARHPW